MGKCYIYNLTNAIMIGGGGALSLSCPSHTDLLFRPLLEPMGCSVFAEGGAKYQLVNPEETENILSFVLAPFFRPPHRHGGVNQFE